MINVWSFGERERTDARVNCLMQGWAHSRRKMFRMSSFTQIRGPDEYKTLETVAVWLKDSRSYLKTRAETISGDRRRTRRRDDWMLEDEDASSRFSASSWGACVMKESDSVTHISLQPLPLPEVLLSSSDTRDQRTGQDRHIWRSKSQYKEREKLKILALKPVT